MGNTNSVFSWSTTIASTQDILKTREQVQQIAQKIGFRHADQVLLASAVSGICRDLLDHSSSFAICIDGEDGLFIKVYELHNISFQTQPRLDNSRDILNLDFYNSRNLFDKAEWLDIERSEPYLILQKSNIHSRFPGGSSL